MASGNFMLVSALRRAAATKTSRFTGSICKDADDWSIRRYAASRSTLRSNRLLKNSVVANNNMVGNGPYGVIAGITSGCSKRLSSKAAAVEEARRTLRYVEPLSDARTPLADFFSILLRTVS